ncbi:zinc finger protein [Anaeramoeba flamelloides]|uniref:Zinc finger protein n=1 Tax=Anaeramoeba flamelloides TaxID=1746091 RepID=A0ABQ8XCN5_9EUKA|nr:zinc finger protein [Anaeramoeba flamelloides]
MSFRKRKSKTRKRQTISFDLLNETKETDGNTGNTKNMNETLKGVNTKKKEFSTNLLTETTKKRRTVVNTFSYKSNLEKNSFGSRDQGATRKIDVDTEIEKDARTIFEKSQEIQKLLEEEEKQRQMDPKDNSNQKNNKGEVYRQYRGQKGYWKLHNESNQKYKKSSNSMTAGPIRATKHIREISLMDYMPDLCKDWYLNGFCGFGESCKFLHMREQFKSTPQLDREWKKKEKERKLREALNLSNNTTSEKEKEKNDLLSAKDRYGNIMPFKCPICKKIFKNPIVTNCHHYFCQVCALKRFKKSNSCFICKKSTHGIFNPAKQIIEHIKNLQKAGIDLGSQKGPVQKKKEPKKTDQK